MRLIALQTVLLVLVLVGATIWTTRFGTTGERTSYDIKDVVRDALQRDADGGLTLRPTPRLLALRQDIPRLWFVVRDRQGQVLSEGRTPNDPAQGDPDQDSGVGSDSRRQPAPYSATTDSAVGPVSILTHTQHTGSTGDLALAASRYYAGLGLTLALLMTLATVVATPIVVRRGLAGLTEAMAQAASIDIERRGARISAARIPAEIAPLVDAFNGALRRLDQGYERDKRFLIDAAHELRTPIAILQTRLESFADCPRKTQLLEDVGRLATLADQLLDLQRLDLQPAMTLRVDLVEIGRRVTADLAPMAIAAGYEISFVTDAEHVWTTGEPASLERALINIVQNAIAHGGRNGAIVVSVESTGSLTVSDEGPGIPPDQHEAVFEPFHRLDARNHGIGLGLNIVRAIVERHQGHVTVSSNVPTGVRFGMSFPPDRSPAP